MTDIRQIADDIYDKEKTKTYHDFVENFEKQQNAIDTVDYNATVESQEIYSKLLADYGIALSEIKSYKKAIPILTKSLELISNNKKYSPETLYKLETYELSLFKRGFCNYHLDNYELARLDFELLIKHFPDNSIYPKWINAIKNHKIVRLKNISWYFVAGAVLIEGFLDKTPLLKTITLGLGLIAFLFAILVETILYLERRKYGA
jgi:tetratricopeptide (TPR) repeat protein